MFRIFRSRCSSKFFRNFSAVPETTVATRFFPLSSMVVAEQILSSKSNSHVIHSLDENKKVVDAVRSMVDNNIGSVLVNNGNKISGILTERDYLKKIVLQGRSSENTLVQEVMSTDVAFVSADTSLETCLHLFNELNIRHLPVQKTKSDNLASDNVLGIFSVRDVTHTLCSFLSSTEYNSYLESAKRFGDSDIKEFTSSNFETIDEEETVYNAISKMSEKNIGSILVTSPSSSAISGLITERDYLRKVILQGRNSRNMKVKEIMTGQSKLKFFDPKSHVFDCIAYMAENSFRQVMVGDQENTALSFTGLVTIQDLLRA